MAYTRDEQETSILCDGNPNAPWSVYSCVPKHVRKLKELAKQWGVEYTEGKDGSITVNLPMKAVAFRKPSTRKVSDEQKAAAAERFKKMWEDRKSDDDEDEDDDSDDE
jgi:hypothetical protein